MPEFHKCLGAQGKTLCADLHFTLTIIYVEVIPRKSNVQVREWRGLEIMELNSLDYNSDLV